MRLFFNHHAEDGYTRKTGFFEEHCRYCGKYKACDRKDDPRVQCAMMHMYIDLSLKKNEDLTNKERRYILCTYYTALVHGPLPKGCRRKVDRCVRSEIKQLYPDPIYTEYKDA